ncbi:MAG: response regulator [Burkholderiaceae bacterium]|nr:response regulator [Burkholderiaceae bacterium]
MEVLIVDDNEINREVLSTLVESLPGNHARAFADARESLAYCSNAEPDLYVVDYMMPGMDGIEFVQRVRALPGRSEVPIVMVTGADDRSIRRRALEAGATDFVCKPVEATEFLVRIRNMLKLRQAYRQLANRAESLADQVAKRTEEIKANERDTLLALARAAEYRDPETGAHIVRMASYARLIGDRLGMTTQEQDLLEQAAPLHDLGKIGTPDSILLKPGPLTSEERSVMQQHTTIGWQILSTHASPVLQAGAVIAHSHHEKFDGSGYPLGRSGEDIPLHGRIVAVADVLDALTSVRPYKPAWPIERARGYLVEGRGGHFDPQCVDAILERWSDAVDVMHRYAD